MALFLQELDGFKTAKNVIVIGATNIPDQLDPALMRPGRFDKVIYMHLPDKEAREEIFKVHCRKLPIADDVDFKKLAKLTERYSGADIKNICSEATRAAAREALKTDKIVPIEMKHFLDVLDSIKPSVGIDQLETYDKFRLDFERRSGKKKSKEVPEEAVRWPDVAGLEGVKQALLEAIEIPLLHEDLMKQLKVKPSKGLLLFGPPGCGKTMVVKAAANELKATFLSVSGADIMKKGYDYGVGIMKETFNRAREQAPALVFIDEIESLAPSRSNYSSPVLTQLLTELDGVRELKNVMFIGATNKPSIIDPALMRPGRFDKILYIPPPDFEARKKLFELNLSAVMNDKLSAEDLAEVTEGFSGADIASICQEAKMQVVREKIKGSEKALSTKDIVKVIKGRRPSITGPMLREFAEFMDQYGERK
jgi:SpoVK/Ycf46/Vps4 family AAA+-type ATPase